MKSFKVPMNVNQGYTLLLGAIKLSQGMGSSSAEPIIMLLFLL